MITGLKVPAVDQSYKLLFLKSIVYQSQNWFAIVWPICNLIQEIDEKDCKNR